MSKADPKFPLTAFLSRWDRYLTRQKWSLTENSTCRRTFEKDKWTIWLQPDGTIDAWGPDGLVIELNGKVPSKANLAAALRICGYCQKSFPPEQIKRIGFAGRCCGMCRLKHMVEVEYPGWNR